jgi:hypothetical protein
MGRQLALDVQAPLLDVTTLRPLRRVAVAESCGRQQSVGLLGEGARKAAARTAGFEEGCGKNAQSLEEIVEWQGVVDAVAAMHGGFTRIEGVPGESHPGSEASFRWVRKVWRTEVRCGCKERRQVGEPPCRLRRHGCEFIANGCRNGCGSSGGFVPNARKEMVGTWGLEPQTSTVSKWWQLEIQQLTGYPGLPKSLIIRHRPHQKRN